ncbi:DUF937 domain-containing protein [Aetokthonos hydrillicola Thurmond2011]|jgi:hypothetical protein|uniref:DUF937 domain-containing protein n=1 Tax=Aetokthonos hydrillicola Thurmond2011 TaxID=2712845 RepID=A0AAP5M493_9CYAN|nr:DUF937 domain-containing protein [Aetokthonos hydrillicola]MBO3457665.1 hypothetical protein [Aetokthonos hydrillicola CCALA 1050]MBW4587944.1 hypothetical protein [Aetokthonos hydrillicola CCALA 1050]MDR9894651.1 DUF937 domain-containing protein [Aetokthonos hydrillicola Thurmond2011]
MGLFDEILSAVNNPNLQGSTGQLGSILNTVQQISNTTGADPSTIQSVLGIVGNYVRSSLQEKQATEGDEAAQAVVNEFGGTSPNSQAVESLLSPFIQEEIGQVVQERTGLDAGIIQQFLPMLVPVVLHLLKSGANAENPEGEGNPVLNSFLQGEGGGDFNIGSVVQIASRFLGH